MSEYDLNAELNELPNYELQAELTKQNSYNANLIIQSTPKKTSELINDGDGTSPYATEEYVLRHADKLYVHDQGVASSEWIIEHNLNKYPAVMVVDSANNVLSPEIEYIDKNTVIVRSNGEFKGRAYLN